MDLLHLHLLLNHVPVIGIPIGAGLLAWGLVRRERVLQRAALAVLLLVGLVAGPVFVTGEPAEERVEDLAGVDTPMIERHESAGQLAVAASLLVCCAAAGGLFLSRRQRAVPRGVSFGILLMALLAAGTVVQAGYLGGRIRHTELNGQAAAADGEDEKM